MKTQFLTGDVNWLAYGGKWVLPKLSNGEFDYWLVVEFINMDEACGCDNEGYPRYIAEISAVSPDEAGPENLTHALECCGLSEDVELTELMKVEVLHTYGIKALCDSFSGNNGRRILREAKRALDPIASMLGFFMDGPKNRIGHTGWDCLKGDMSIDAAQANRDRWGTTPPPNMHVQEA